ncbi:ABC transporter ATP-binding protein [Halobellus clavatus]|uniref:Simple sugar transport system ATP-binding protein n=1 Tax=Halobellus clavatus TaxID=660517 RepID=A0A1H3HKH6_9EURY|nr:ABC transporter ATP-binding protein [Halobellus clavatus]SDY15997.1 simple sugar transport system ATP-binding protein [Halobellus clavatus]
MSEDAFVRLADITKTFPGVVANDEISMSIRKGEIHGLLGENGAGKSTLMKILYGLYSSDGGDVWIDGERAAIESPQDAIDAGIGMVHQHFKLIPRLSVAKNVVLGMREPASAFRADGDDDGFVSSLTTNRLVQGLAARFTLGLDVPEARIQSLADDYGFDIDVTAPVWQLDVGERQRVEILKALYRDVDLLILDEPTAVLTPTEAERLFETLRKLSDQGLSIIIITHKLKEVKSITDRVTVLRDGSRIDTVETADVSRADLARMMVGRDVLFQIDKDEVTAGEPVLKALDLRTDDDRGIEALSGVDLTVHAGEIVGIAGVSGNGQIELAESLVGIRPVTDGTIRIDGGDLTGAPPRAFIEHGVSFVPEDRHKHGCAESLSVMHNAILKGYTDEAFGDGLRLDYDASADYAETLVENFDVRGVSDVAKMQAGELSGGNLQKLILAREMDRDPKLLVANQPTRGVDVGAIEYIREGLIEQRDQGTGILLLSENLDEIFDLSDRILVMYEGEFVYEVTPEAADRRRIGLEMNGGEAGGAEPQVAVDGGRSES